MLLRRAWGDADRPAILGRMGELLVVCGDPQQVVEVGGPGVGRRLGIS